MVRETPSEIHFGLVPVQERDETAVQLEAIAGALARRAGLPCRIHRAISPASLAFSFESGAVNLAWSSPTLVLAAPEMRSAIPLVCSKRQGETHYHGVLFVRRDSPLTSPLQLRGTRAAWVAPTSAAGFIFPRVALAGHGIDPSSLFASEQHLGSHGAVVRAVLDGEADVAATFAVFDRGDPTRPLVRSGTWEVPGGREGLRILFPTLGIPSDLIVASPVLARALAGRLVPALEALCRDVPEAALHVFGADAFVECDRRRLEDLARQLDDARALGVLE